jgi:hypothetical protein
VQRVGLGEAVKYHNKPCQIGVERYRSQRERDKHQALLLRQKAGQISGLVREVAFVLAPGVKIAGEKRARPALRYVADFVYSDTQTGQIVVADAKGMATPLWRAKKHLMATVLGIHVVEL